jgi:hypothetical protein
MLHADERHIVDLGVRAVHPAAADRRLVFARQVREVGITQVPRGHFTDLRRRVEHLVRRDTGKGAAQDHTWRVPARLLRGQPNRIEPFEDSRDVLDADPMELYVLSVRDVGDVTPEPFARPRDRAELVARHLAAVDPDAHHEELVLELFGLRRTGALARHALFALRVQAVPSQARTKVLLAD